MREQCVKIRLGGQTYSRIFSPLGKIVSFKAIKLHYYAPVSTLFFGTDNTQNNNIEVSMGRLINDDPIFNKVHEALWTTRGTCEIHPIFSSSIFFQTYSCAHN